MVLVGFEPEDENGSIFLRLRKASRAGLKVVAIASHATRGLRKMSGELRPDDPGHEPAALAALELDQGAIFLRRRATRRRCPAASAPLVAAADKAGARIAWVPRRAGERGAVETGCLPDLLPGGRPLDDVEARTDLAAAWGVRTVPARRGRNTTEIFEDTRLGTVHALLVGGVEIDDLPDPARGPQGARQGGRSS